MGALGGIGLGILLFLAVSVFVRGIAVVGGLVCRGVLLLDGKSGRDLDLLRIRLLELRVGRLAVLRQGCATGREQNTREGARIAERAEHYVIEARAVE